MTSNGESMVLESISITLKILLICGIISAILNVCVDIVGIMFWKGYNFISQSISELNAVESPIRQWILPLNALYYGLLIIFGIGVLVLDPKNHFLQLIGLLLIGNGLFTLTGIIIYPKYMGESINSINNSKNTIVMAIGVLSILIAIVLGIFAFENWFRYVSLGIVILFIVLTIVGLFVIPTVNPGAILAGIQERTMVYTYQLWIILLSLALLYK